MKKNIMLLIYNKYYYKINILKKTIQLGSLIAIRVTKGKGRKVFLGILLKTKKRNNFMTITLRNSYKKYTFEKSFVLSNSIIKEIRFLKNAKIITKKYNLFYIRKRKRTLSTY